jgi:hypothetical protein
MNMACPHCRAQLDVGWWRFLPGDLVLKSTGEVKCVACDKSSYIPDSAQFLGFISSLASIFGWWFVLGRAAPTLHLYASLVLTVALSMGTGALIKRAATRSLRRDWNENAWNG